GKWRKKFSRENSRPSMRGAPFGKFSGDSREGHWDGPADGGGMPRGGPRSRSRAMPPHSDIAHRKLPGPHRDSLPAGPGGPTDISGIDYHSIPHEHLRARVPVDPKVARVARSSMPGA